MLPVPPHMLSAKSGLAQGWQRVLARMRSGGASHTAQHSRPERTPAQGGCKIGGGASWGWEAGPEAAYDAKALSSSLRAACLQPLPSSQAVLITQKATPMKATSTAGHPHPRRFLPTPTHPPANLRPSARTSRPACLKQRARSNSSTVRDMNSRLALNRCEADAVRAGGGGKIGRAHV